MLWSSNNLKSQKMVKESSFESTKRSYLEELRLDQDGVKLIPANSTMSPIVLNNTDVEVLGIVRGVIRDRI